MGFSSNSKLTPLQRDLLIGFFDREQRFFLTGGAALAGFYFGHRTTEDLDLFSAPGPDLADAARTVTEVARGCGADAVPQKTFEEFRRLLVTRGDEQCIVDLVVDRAPAVDPEKEARGSIRIDTLREIAANKLSTLLGRSELKDLIDVREILAMGAELRQVVEDGQRKDGSVDPATLAWVLSQLKISSSARLPYGVAPAALDKFRSELVGRLEDLAFEQAQGGAYES